MIRLINRRLIIPRGDTGSFTVPLLTEASSADVSIFTIFDCLTHKKVFNKVITAADNILTVEFTHEDTVNLVPGKYVWDIKFYKNPVFAEGELISGEEVHSYYAGFALPVCEIKETGDTLLTADDAPTSTMSPQQLNIITSAISETNAAKVNAAASASAAAGSAADANASATSAASDASSVSTMKSEVEASAAQVALDTAATTSAKNTAVSSAESASSSATAADASASSASASAATATTKANEASASATVAENAKIQAAAALSDIQTLHSSLAQVATSGDYDDLINKPTIPEVPTNVSAFTNDVGYLTEHQDISGKANSADLAAVATSGSYNDLSNKPTNVSAFTNDAGYLTSFTETDPTVPSWAKAAQKPTYTAAEVGATTTSDVNSLIASAIGNVHQFNLSIVQALPIENIDTHTIYLVPKTGDTNDVYDEYVYINNAWEMIGNTQIDLSNYVQKTDYATSETGGVVKVSSGFGVGMLNSGVITNTLVINPANLTSIKRANSAQNADNFKPIVPVHQHESTFYGLAKAAGDSTQSDSSNAVGTYTDEAKAAIQQMLGVSGTVSVPVEYGSEVGAVQTKNFTHNNNYYASTASNVGAFAEGTGTASGMFSHAEGNATRAQGQFGHAEGQSTHADARWSHAEGRNTEATGEKAHAEGDETNATGESSHAEGNSTTASGSYSHAEGDVTVASAAGAHAEGRRTQAVHQGAHAEGIDTIARWAAHAEGESTQANGQWSHAEGVNTKANMAAAHAEGEGTIANATSSHVVGKYNAADSYDNWIAWAANTEYSVGDKVKKTQTINNEETVVGYICKTANSDATFDVQHWDLDSNHMNFVEIVGNGYNELDDTTHQEVRHGSNARALDWDGNEYLAGDVYVHANSDSTGGTKVATISDIPNVPVTDVQVNGTSVLSNGMANVPLANTTTPGTVIVGSGLTINASNKITIDSAGSGTIKTGTNVSQPIVPSKQHESTFYGLAKASGDSTQSSSNNSVGSYTDEAKGSIQHMLGTDTMIAPNETNPFTTAHDAGYLFTYNGKLYHTKTNVVAAEAFNIGTNIEEASVVGTTVHDVQVNGTSILSNGVANIPYAITDNNAGTYYPGVVSVAAQGGEGLEIANESTGRIKISSAGYNQIKAGTNTYRPLVPVRQHASIYYGLAKLAGADMASVTGETIGIYPDAQKAAIQHMLGTDTLIAPYESDTTADQSYAVSQNFMMNGKLYTVTQTIAQGETIVPGTNCDQTSIEAQRIRDVKVNGSSIVSSGIANIPIAGDNTLGLVQAYGGDGIACSNGAIYINRADSAQIKDGSNKLRPIVPYSQDSSVFYGLAKVAGADMKNSNNAVGTYTQAAKTAIQTMLGITQTITITVNTQDNVTVTNQTVTVREDDKNGPIFATATYSGQPVSFAVPNGFHYYISVSDTLAHHFNPTTASGIVANADVSVILTYSDFSNISSASDIKAALNAGLDLTDLVGEQITCTRDNATLTWDVVDYDATNKTIMLLLHDAFGSANMVFEPAQALMWCENGLAAGNYKFTVDTTVYYFILTQAIPAGGQLVASDAGTFSTYASQSATATTETGTVSTTEISGATDLGTAASGLLNHNSRVRYGSNNYAESALLWWLNSDAAANTQRVPVTKFSRAYAYNAPGFLYNLDPDFIACLDDVEWKCSTNNVYECPQSLGGYTAGTGRAYTITKKVGLASEMEIFGSYGGNTDGSTVFDLYNGASADDRKKYRNTTAQNWWLRSPNWGNASSGRYVGSSGSAYNYNAYNSYSVVPAVRISADEEEET